MTPLWRILAVRRHGGATWAFSMMAGVGNPKEGGSMPAKVAFLLRSPVLWCAHTGHRVGRHWSVCGLLDVRQGRKWRRGRVRSRDLAPDHDVVLALLRPHSEHGS